MAIVWRWISASVGLAIHAEQIREHGGPAGVRDAASFESAMARAANFAAYEKEADAAALAACYAFGIARNHPFVDGNKRSAAVISETFLALNGFMLETSDAEMVVAFMALAAGELTEAEMADWFRQRVVVA